MTRTVAERGCMSMIDISPKQSFGPRIATRVSRARRLFFSTSISPSRTTYISRAGSPSRKMMSPTVKRITVSVFTRYSRKSSESAPKRPTSRSCDGVTFSFAGGFTEDISGPPFGGP